MANPKDIRQKLEGKIFLASGKYKGESFELAYEAKELGDVLVRLGEQWYNVPVENVIQMVMDFRDENTT